MMARVFLSKNVGCKVIADREELCYSICKNDVEHVPLETLWEAEKEAW